jgi:hypothetical protein
MPWTVADVDRHKKGLSPEQKKAWVSIANSVLKSCHAKGGKDCEGKAVRIANGKSSSSQSEIDAYINSLSVVNFASSIGAKQMKDIRTETTEEGLLIHDLPVFKAGTYRDVVYSEDYIDRNLVGQFSVDEDVPVQADHNPSAFATLGWVKAVSRKGSMMLSDFLLIDENAIARWKKGLIKKFSISVNILQDKLREISIVAFPYVKSARVHGECIEEDEYIDATEADGKYVVTVEGEQFEAKKDENDLWFFFPISRRDADGEIVQEESVNITDEDIDNIDVNTDLADEEDPDYSYGDDLTKEDFAKWTAKYKNSLPDSSFLLVRRPVKDKSGDRALPIKDASGKISRSHVRNALARVNKVKEFSSDNTKGAAAKLKRIAKKLGMEVKQKKSEGLAMAKKKIDLRELDITAYEGEAADIIRIALAEYESLEKSRDEALTKLTATEKSLAGVKTQLKEAKVDTEIAKLKGEGKILPANEESTKKLMLSLNETQIDEFVGVLSKGKPAVDFNETSAGGSKKEEESSKDAVDTEAASAEELNVLAEKVAKEQDMDFHEALDLVYDGKIDKAGKRIE